MSEFEFIPSQLRIQHGRLYPSHAPPPTLLTVSVTFTQRRVYMCRTLHVPAGGHVTPPPGDTCGSSPTVPPPRSEEATNGTSFTSFQQVL